MRNFLKRLFSSDKVSSPRRRSRKHRQARRNSPETLESRTLLTSEFALVSDINTSAVSSLPSSSWEFAQLNDLTFFIGQTETNGTELWVTDGTPDGTRMVRDIYPTPEGDPIVRSSHPRDLVVFNDKLYFTANDGGEQGRELWVSDGTEEGTQMLVDLYPRSRRSSSPNFLTVAGDTLFFWASDSSSSRGLYKTDGTAAGTTFVTEIRANYDPVALGDTLYFQSNHGGHGYELWKSDGTEAGTVLVKDVNPGAGNGAGAPAVIGDRLFFSGTHPDSGQELWISDGTEAGTQLLVDMVPGPGTAYPNTDIVALDGKFYFRPSQHNTPGVGQELWVSDGTPAGTRVVRDINPGNPSASPRSLQAYRDQLYFVAKDGSGQWSWWQTDGTEAGTQKAEMGNLDPLSVRDTTVFNDRLYVSSYVDGRYVLSKTDTTIEGTGDLGEIGPGSLNIVTGSDVLYFTARIDGKSELWRTDGSASGTSLLRDITPGTGSSDPRGLTSIGDNLIFSAEQPFSFNNGEGGRELWVTGGTSDSTRLLREFGTARNEDGDPHNFITLNGVTLFNATEARKNGLRAIDHATQEIRDLSSTQIFVAEVSSPSEVATLGDSMIGAGIKAHGTESTGLEVIISDGTVDGTSLLKDIRWSFASSSPGGFTRLGDEVFFSAVDDMGREFWKTDGTTAGTVRVKDIFPGNHSGVAGASMVAVNDLLLFAASSDSSTGVELWVSDGTESGTTLLKDLWTDSHRHSRPQAFVSDGTKAFFFATNEDGLALYQSDATADSTTIIHQFDSEAVVPNVRAGQTLLTDGLLYFVMEDAEHGSELWVSNGLGSGTRLLKDVNPGEKSSNIEQLTQVGDVVYFVATDEQSGREVWETNGTSDGTRLAADVLPGPESSTPLDLTNHNSVLYFTSLTTEYGRELFKLNATPSANSAEYSTEAGSDVEIALSGADADGSPVTYTVVVEPRHGTLTGSAPNLVYTPASGFSGADEFYFTTSDGIATSLPARVGVTVRGSKPIVSFNSSVANVSEASGTVDIPFSLDRTAEYSFTIPLVLSGTAASGIDFDAPAAAAVSAGATSGVLTVEIIDDSTFEPGAAETLSITMQAGDNYDLGAQTSATLEIADNDSRPTVTFERGYTVVDEVAGTAAVRIIASASSTQPIEVPFTVAGTATEGSDFIAPSSSVAHLAPGARFVDIEFEILNDAEIESLENIVFQMGIPVNADFGTGSGQRRRSTVSIRPNDIPLVRFSASSTQLVENSGSSQITVQLDEPAPSSFTVPFTLDGTASASSDFSLSAQQFEFEAGDTEASVTLTLNDDTDVEGSEFAVLTLKPAQESGYELGARRNGLIYVIDDDAELSVEVSESEVWEDHHGDIDVTISLGTALAVDTDIVLTFASTLEHDGRFTLDGSDVHSRIITIPKFESSVTTSLNIADDSRSNPDAVISLSARRSEEPYEDRKTAQVLVKDNDPTLSLSVFVAPQPASSATPAFALGSATSPSRLTYKTTGSSGSSSSSKQDRRQRVRDRGTRLQTVSENVGNVRLDFRLSKETNQPVSFDLTTFGTATVGAGGATWPDIVDRSGLLNSRITIPAGQGYHSPYSLTVGIVDDSTYEEDETLLLSASNALNANIPRLDPNNGRLISKRHGVIRVKLKVQDDDTKPTVSLEADSRQIHEAGDHRRIKLVDGQPLPRGEYFMINVYLSRPVSRDLEVELASTGIAQNGRDFRIVGLNTDGKVVIPAGHRSTRLRVEAIDDAHHEGDERLELRLQDIDQPMLADVSPDNSRVTVVMIDNDSPPAPPKPEPPPTLEVSKQQLENETAEATPGALQISNAQGAFGEVSPEEVERLNASFEANAVGINPFPGPFQLGNAALGFLDGATVFLDSNFNGIPDFIDANNNGIQDPGELTELSTTTEYDGAFGLKFAPAYDMDGDQLFGTGDGRYVLIGGEDITIGSSRPVQLTAPVGTFSITPLSTVVEAMVRRHLPSVDASLTRVSQAFGIDGYDIRFGNALYQIVHGDALAAEAYKQSVLLHNTALQIASAYSGSAEHIDAGPVVSTVYDTIADFIHTERSVLNLSRAEVLRTLVDAVGFELGAELSGSVKSGLLEVMLASAGRIAELQPVDFASEQEFADQVLKIKKVVREEVVDRLEHAAGGGEPISDVVHDFTGASLDQKIAQSATRLVVPSTIVARSAKVVEGDSGQTSMEFEVVLLGDHNQTVSVDYRTVDDTARVTNGDYTAVSGTLTWPAGDNAVKTIHVPVHGDSDVEGDERFSLLLSNAVHGVIRHGQGYGFIVNDDSYSSAFASLPAGEIRRTTVSTGPLSGSARVDGVSMYDGVFSEPIHGIFTGQDSVDDQFLAELSGAALRPDHYVFSGGETGIDSLQWLAEGVTSMSVGLGAEGSGSATLTTDADLPPVLLTWSQIETLSSSTTINEHLEIHLDPSLAARLVLEDADPAEFGRMRLRDLNETMPPFEFSNPLTSLKIVAANADTTLTTASPDERFQSTVEFTTSSQNQAPAGLNISSTSIPENSGSDSVVGQITTTDPDDGDSFTYSLVTGAGGADNSRFTISGDQLKIGESPNFETKDSYSLRIRTTDSGGLSFEKSFTITVEDLDEAAPSAVVSALPLTWDTSTISINVELDDSSGPAAEPKSGVASYDLYMAAEDGDWTLLADDVPASQTQVTFNASSDTRYWFRAVATDAAGNVEDDPGIPEANTHTLDVDAPNTQVVAATADSSSGVITLQLQGTDSGGSGLKAFQVYVSVDNQPASPVVGSPVAAGPETNGAYSATLNYQGLLDGAQHTYRFFTRGIDHRGNTEDAPTAPADQLIMQTFTQQTGFDARGIDVQLGQQQRSYIRYVDVLFAGSDNLMDLFNEGRISVERFSPNATSAAVGTGQSITGFGATSRGNSLQLDFGANGIGGRRQAGDGFYRISVDLDGDGETDDAHFEFFRLWGDANGDGRVTRNDSRRIFEDLNGDGRVDSRDRRDVRRRVGHLIDDELLKLIDD